MPEVRNKNKGNKTPELIGCITRNTKEITVTNKKLSQIAPFSRSCG